MDFRTECEANEKRCLSENKCVQKNWVCDGEKDCRDGSDETDNFCSKLFSIIEFLILMR